MYFLCELPLCENWWSVVSFSDDWPPTCETFILWRKLCVSPKNVDEEHHFWAKKIPLKLTPELVATLKFSDWMGCASITTWFPFPLRWGWIGLLLQQKKHNFTCGKCGLKWRRGTNFANQTLRSHLDLDVLSCWALRLFIHACVTWNTEYLLDKSKLTWLEHCSFKASGSDLSSSYAILHCENCAAVRCESRHMRLALPPKLHHYCCFCLSNNNSFKQCCSWS